MKSHRLIAFALGLFLMGSLLAGEAEAQKGSSKPPSSSGNSSSGSSGSKPKFSAPPAAPKPSSPPANTAPPKPPANTAPPKNDPPANTAPPKNDSNKPKFSAPPANTAPPKKEEEKPKFSAPPANTAPPKNEPPKSNPPTGPPAANVKGSEKPKSPAASLSEKARAAKENRSEVKWQESQKATAPPIPKYTAPSGKEVTVRTGSKDVEHIRNLPSTSVKPEVLKQNVHVHVTQNNYQHPPSWYYSQPTVYVGGGYSSAFWYMMGEWSAERRAAWLYNHRYDIESDAYQRGLRDAEVARRVAEMESRRVTRNANYVDPEFSKNPERQYDEDYVVASYNPTVTYHPTTSHDSGSARTVFYVLGAIVLIGVIAWAAYALFFKVRWGS